MTSKVNKAGKKDPNAKVETAKANEATASGPVSMDAIASILEEHRTAILAEFRSAFTILEAKFDCMQSAVAEHGQKIASLESNANLQDERLLALETTCASLVEDRARLQAKITDLESRSRRNNIRIVGLPEAIEGPRPTAFFAELLTEVLGSDILPTPPELDRAHRTLAARPKPGDRPRAVIIRLHRYQQKERIIREARSRRGSLQFRGSQIAIYEDYAPEVVEQRSKFREVLSELYNLGLKPALLFPARLIITTKERGSSAVTPVFVQTGKDLHLNVTKAVTLEERDVLAWKFNGDSNVVRYFSDNKTSISQSYTGRIDVTGENYSLKLKNPTKADSGVYTAQIIGEENVRVAEYNVTVQDPVSPVKLRLDPASGSSDSCNVTVTCSTQDSHINSTFTCDRKTCSQEEGEQSEVTTSGVSLHVFVTNGFIVCNHSNQVSWTKDRKKVEHLCIQQEGSKQSTGNITVPAVVSVIITLIVLISLAVAFYYLRKRRNSKTEKIENTVYEVPQQIAMRPVDQTQTVDDSVNSPTSTYSLVGPHTGGRTIPESLYAQVERPKS